MARLILGFPPFVLFGLLVPNIVAVIVWMAEDETEGFDASFESLLRVFFPPKFADLLGA